MAERDLSDVLRIDTSLGVVRVWHGRSARDAAEADAILTAIDEALDETGVPLLMFDSRDADRTTAAVQQRIWDWLTNHPVLRQVATVMHSDMLAISVRMTGLSRGVRIKAFADEEAALEWLLGPSHLSQ